MKKAKMKMAAPAKKMDAKKAANKMAPAKKKAAAKKMKY